MEGSTPASLENSFSSDRVLFLCSHVPSSNAKEAGHKTAWRNIERLATKSQVDLLLIVNDRELSDIPNTWPDGVRLLHVMGLSQWQKVFSVLFGFGVWSPRFAVRFNKRGVDLIGKLLSGCVYSEVWCEFTEIGCYVDLFPDKVRLTVSAHDVLIQWALRCKGFLRYFASSVFLDELKIMRRADAVIVQSPKDADLIRSLYSIDSVIVDRPALSDFVKCIHRNSSTIKPFSLLFWGAMARPENYNAILGFLKDHWPLIKHAYPQAVIFVVGSNPPSELFAYASDDVVVTGFVEDPSSYFEMAAVGIAPLQEGAGVKVKVLEMLEAGIPVISTPVGAEGIVADDLLTVVDYIGFNKKIRQVFDVV